MDGLSSSSDDDDSLLSSNEIIHDASLVNNVNDDDDDDDNDLMILAVCEAAVGVTTAAELSIIGYQDIILPLLMTKPAPWGGSIRGKLPNKNRDFDDAFKRLIKDYFSGNDSVYDEVHFERRFRLSRSLFLKIYEAIVLNPPFIITQDCTGKAGIHPLIRMSACLRFLFNGRCYDADDEYLRLSESSIHVAVRVFVRLVKEKFGANYLNRNPTEVEKDRILSINKKRGFPGMFASWDCTHFKWEKCPIADHGAFKSRKKIKTIILEACVDCNLRIWYSNFGCPGSMNDINVLDKSTIIQEIVTGKFDIRTKPYMINGTYRDYMYFLVDGIYPKYAIFQSTGNKEEGTEEEKLFCMQQESVRKDVERVFAVLQCKFQVLHRAFRGWDIGDITDIVEACIIIHNMIVENNVGEILLDDNNDNINVNQQMVSTIFNHNVNATRNDKIQAIENAIECVNRNNDLKIDLMEHIFENIDQIRVYTL